MSAHERVIAELRGRAERCGLVGQHDRADDLLAAAVALETLPAEVERLTAERDGLRAEVERWKARYTGNAAQAVAAMAIRDELRAEVERLRASVGDVLAAHGCDCECECAWDEHDDDCERCLGCQIDAALAKPCPDCRDDGVVEVGVSGGDPAAPIEAPCERCAPDERRAWERAQEVDDG